MQLIPTQSITCEHVRVSLLAISFRRRSHLLGFIDVIILREEYKLPISSFRSFMHSQGFLFSTSKWVFNLDVTLLLNFDLVVSVIVIDNILHIRPIKNLSYDVRRRVFWHIFNNISEKLFTCIIKVDLMMEVGSCSSTRLHGFTPQKAEIFKLLSWKAQTHYFY